MKLSTRARYGTRAMVELALAYPDRAVSVRQMGQSQHLSVKYLERIMAGLKGAGLAKAVLGVHGGYTLARPPKSITLDDVLRALDGPIALAECVEHPEACPMIDSCATRGTWVEISGAFSRILEGTTLQDLVERSGRRGD